LVKQTGHPDDGVELEQREGRRGVLEIHLARFELLFERVRQGVRVHLEADRQCGFRAHPPPTPPFFSPAIALWSCSVSPQKASLPKVS
jgi:hypothetical protein